MIITVTMNPAVDKTVVLEQPFIQGGLNRLSRVLYDAGGKGINVSKTIQALGGRSLATGFLGGSAETIILESLKKRGIETDFVHIESTTRTNTKLVEINGCVSELNEPGPEIQSNEYERIQEIIFNRVREKTIVVLSGSIPPGIPTHVYRDLTEALKIRGAKVFLDADGEIFSEALKAVPHYIKPNRVELEQYFHLDHKASEKELVEMGQQLLKKGVQLAAVSLGEEGALFISKDGAVKAKGLKVNTKSTVGAGDAMVAALCLGLDQNMDFCQYVRLSMATSAGAVMTEGTNPPSLAQVEALMSQVEIVKVNQLNAVSSR